MYGSGSISWHNSVILKKGQEGHNRDFSISSGSHGTQKLDLSFNGKNDYYDYFIGYTNFSTEGESAMRDNDEKMMDTEVMA